MRVIVVIFLAAIATATQAQIILETLPGILKRERLQFKEPCDDHSARKTFDFIIVGAGAAGSVLANRLTEDAKWKVLLLEAGGEETLVQDIPYFSGQPAIQDDWGFTMGPTQTGCVGAPNTSCPYTRAKVMGGCTTINNMVAVRGNVQDYDNWENLGNEGWGYEDVLPYFKKLEDVQIPEHRNSLLRGTEGYVPISYSPYKVPGTDEFLEAAQELDISMVDYNGESQEGVSRIQFTQRKCSRVSANGAYLFPIHDRKNLFVRKRSMVLRLIIENKVAVGVEYERDGQILHAYARKEVILSAGAIMSPVILMLSGIGPKEHLEKFDIPVVSELPVGDNLKDHPGYYGLNIIFEPGTFPSNSDNINSPQNYIDYFEKCTGPLSWSLLETVRYFHVGNSSDRSWPNMESYHIYYEVSGIQQSPIGYGVPPNFYENFFEPLENESSTIYTVLLMRPRSSGFVRLTGNDIRHPPHIDPRMLTDETDVEEMAEAVMVATEIFYTETMQRFGARVYNRSVPGCEDFEHGSLEYTKCAVRIATHNMYHPCCTCSMGPDDDPNSVVDDKLRVRGIEGLRVIDASVFPEMPTAHTMIPTYMVAEKGADIIKEHYAVVP